MSDSGLDPARAPLRSAIDRYWDAPAAAAPVAATAAAAPTTMVAPPTLSRAGSLSGPTTVATPVRPRGPRRSRLQLARVDPWSVLKATLVFATCLLVVFVVAVAVLYAILSAMGVFSSVESTLNSALDVHLPLSAFDIIGGALVLGLVNVVLMSALTTVMSFVYNITADLVGGIEVVLTETQ